MNICFFCFFPLSFKKYNKLYEYIYTYFFIIPIIPLNYFFYNKIVVGVIIKKNLDYIFFYIIGVLENLKATNIYIFSLNQNLDYIFFVILYYCQCQ